MKAIVDEVAVDYSNHKMKLQLFPHLWCDKTLPSSVEV